VYATVTSVADATALAARATVAACSSSKR